MRRLLAITVALLIGIGLAAPLLASGSALGNLPECCRREGRHHCAGGMTDGPGRGLRSAGPRCSDYPSNAAASRTSATAGIQATDAGVMLAIDPASPRQMEAKYRVSYGRSRQKRGPPTHLL